MVAANSWQRELRRKHDGTGVYGQQFRAGLFRVEILQVNRTHAAKWATGRTEKDGGVSRLAHKIGKLPSCYAIIANGGNKCYELSHWMPASIYLRKTGHTRRKMNKTSALRLRVTERASYARWCNMTLMNRDGVTEATHASGWNLVTFTLFSLISKPI